MKMLPAMVLAVLFPLILPASEPGWELKSSDKGIKVWTRERAGTRIREVKTSGLVDAPSWRVLKVITDHDHYADFMPHTKESRILSKTENVVHFYTRVAPPLTSERDYTLRLVSTRDPQKPGQFMTRFDQANDSGPPEKKGVVRVSVVNGYWLMEPANEGTQTMLTYYVFTDPGGGVPTHLVNAANTRSVPAIIQAVRERVPMTRYDCRDGNDMDCGDWKEITR